jgi:hypothetical protein
LKNEGMLFRARENARLVSLTHFARPDNESAVRRFQNEGCTMRRDALHAAPHAAPLHPARADCQAFVRV